MTTREALIKFLEDRLLDPKNRPHYKYAASTVLFRLKNRWAL